MCFLPCIQIRAGAQEFDAVKDWGQEEKGATENETVGYHHWLNGHEFEQALGDCEGQRSLVCCSPWGGKVRHEWATEQLVLSRIPQSPSRGRCAEQFSSVQSLCCCCQVASVVSHPVRPHRRQPTRLRHPWDSPGKNTGVGGIAFSTN